jgi:translation initiation factor 1
MKSKSSGGGLVYSTEGGRMCPVCRRPIAQCTCRKSANDAAPSADGIVRVLRETKGRGGKAVTVVRGAAGDLLKLSQELKAACGSGGTVKDGAIEVQGDHVEKIMALLQQRGLKVKRAGG